MLDLIPAESEFKGDPAAMVVAQSHRGGNGHADDFLGAGLGDFLDIHAAFGGGDDDGLGGFAVEDNREIIFVLNFAGLGKVDRLYLASGGAGLFGDQSVVEHPVGGLEGGFAAVDQFNPALEAVGKGALAATAGMNLCLDHYFLAFTQVGNRGFNLAAGLSGVTLGDGDAVFVEESFGLVLVDVHAGLG